jgi:hypothetical protein
MARKDELKQFQEQIASSFHDLADQMAMLLSRKTSSNVADPQGPLLTSEDASCIVCQKTDREPAPMTALKCGVCYKTHVDAKLVHEDCMEAYVVAKLAAGLSVADMPCQLCRTVKQTTTADDKTRGTRAGIDARTNVSRLSPVFLCWPL